MRPVRVPPLLASLLLAALLAGCGGESSEALLQQARQSLEAGDDKAALIHFKSAVQADTENAEARFALGKFQVETGDYAAAEKELRHARQLGYTGEPIEPLLARALVGQGEYKRVIEEIPRPAAGSPGEAALLVEIAQAELATRDTDAARKSLARASEVAPRDPDVMLGLARMAVLDADLPRALQILDDSLETSPKHKNTRLLKADLLAAAGRHDEAGQAYRASLEIDPRLHVARLALANIALAENRVDEARQEAEAAQRLVRNDPRAGYMLALVDYREKKYESARDRLANVLRTAPDYPAALLLAGTTEYALGNLQTAETHLNKVLTTHGRNPVALRALAATKLRQGQAAEATRLLAAYPEEAKDAAYHALAGEIALAQGDASQAALHYDAAARLHPDNAALRTQLGVARLAQGDARAMQDLEMAATLDADDNRADTVIVLNLLQQKKFDEALASIARMEKKSQPGPMTWNYRGAAYLGKNNLDKARESFEQALKLDPGFFPAAVNLAQLDVPAKQFDRARKRFEGILKVKPDNTHAMMALSDLSLHANDRKGHIAWIEKARAADPRAVVPRLAMARHLLEARETGKALILANETFNLYPDNPAVIEMLGNAQFASNDAVNALASYRRLVERQPDRAAPHIKLAVAQVATQDLTGARRSLESALRIEPDNLAAQELLISADIQSGRHDAALATARQVQSQRPKLALGHVLEAQVHMARKQHSDARAAYDRAFAVQPSGILLAQQMQVFNAEGTPEAGEQKITAWLAKTPQDATARAALAESLVKRQQYKAAVEHYLMIDKQSPGNVVVLNNLAWALGELSDKRALTYAAQARKLLPDDPAVLDTHGWVDVRLGNPANGLETLKRAQARAPDSADIQWHLAYAYHTTGDVNRARQELKTLLDRRVPFRAEAEARALYQQLISR